MLHSKVLPSRINSLDKCSSVIDSIYQDRRNYERFGFFGGDLVPAARVMINLLKMRCDYLSSEGMDYDL